jgi:uncharacterized protein YjbI with pentapeptide repeats
MKDYSNKNLRKVSFRGADLSAAHFSDSDLRGTDFSGSNLNGAHFTHVKTGITPVNTILIFLAALIVSSLSGYIAMLAGRTVQLMIASHDLKIEISGYITLILTLLFISYCYWKGVGHAFRNLVIPVIVIAFIIGITAYFSGLGTGKGMLYLVLSLLLVVVMFIIGTISRAVAGSLSNLLFFIVAIGGSLAGKSVGGGIGTVIMAISCAMISKKALSGAKGFESLRKFACYITSRFGTSFRNSILSDADFSHTKIHNSDFSNADINYVNWGDSKKINCLINENLITEKSKSRK